MDDNKVANTLITLLEIVHCLQRNHHKVMTSVLNDLDLSDDGYDDVVRDAEALVKEAGF